MTNITVVNVPANVRTFFLSSNTHNLLMILYHVPYRKQEKSLTDPSYSSLHITGNRCRWYWTVSKLLQRIDLAAILDDSPAQR